MLNKSRALLLTICVLAIATATELSWGRPAPSVLEKKFAFPPPIQWHEQDLQISLVSVLWGPADSPEISSKARRDIQVRKPEFYPDRTYALALEFRANLPNVVATSMITSSGLARIKNVDGDMEAPMELTASGFIPFSGAPGVFDIRFERSNTTEYWDVFPVSPDQKEFLFEVLSASGNPPVPGNSKLSFKIIREGEDFLIAIVSPDTKACLNFSKNFAGTVGAVSTVRLMLRREGTSVSGTEQYVRVGETLWLKGSADSLGNFVMEERYPKDRVTGIFKGTLSPDCHVISGFFSKPDGSRLQPFEFREADATQ